LILIGGLAIYLFSIQMSFEGVSFYLRHNSGLIWASLWMFLFIYWHICAFAAMKNLNDNKSKKMIIWYLMAVADTSFILSTLYVIFGFLFYSVNVCTDSPSIWCTFYVLQSAFIPFFLAALQFMFIRQKKLTRLSFKRTLLYLAISLIIFISLMLTLPFFNCLIWKLAFP